MPRDEHRSRAVSTILTPEERSRVDAAGMGYYRAIHRDQMTELLEDITGGNAEAVILSVARCGEYDRRVVRHLIAEARLIPTIGLISRIDTTTPQMLVELGKWGVSTVIDVRSATGWTNLRAYIVGRANDAVETMVLDRLRTSLIRASGETLAFFEVLLRASRSTGSVRTVCGELGILPSTLMSRFFRAGLPAPKRYLAMIRLIRAVYLFQNSGFSIANVANHLQYSSPQSFGRHVQIVTGMSALTLRRSRNVHSMVDEFLRTLVLPFERAFDTFDPLTTLRYRNGPYVKRRP